MLLSGCTVYHQEVDGGYSREALAAQSAAAGVPLQVDGDVAGVRGAELSALVSGAMPATADAGAMRYASCEPYTECAGDHIVWTFGPPSARAASHYPAAFHVNVDWLGDGKPSASNVAAEVALFQGNSVVASASGQVDAPNGANDPAFKAMIAEMSRAVLSGPNWLD